MVFEVNVRAISAGFRLAGTFEGVSCDSPERRERQGAL